jgi:hypothetical protein
MDLTLDGAAVRVTKRYQVKKATTLRLAR